MTNYAILVSVSQSSLCTVLPNIQLTRKEELFIDIVWYAVNNVFDLTVTTVAMSSTWKDNGQ